MGYTVDSLAEKMNIEYATVSRIYRELSVKIEYIYELSEILGVSTDYLLKGNESDNTKETSARRDGYMKFLDECYLDNHREFQYFVYDYLLAMKQYLTYDDIAKIKKYIITKSWWDTIDFLCKVIGFIGLKDERVKDSMLDWSKSDNIWIKRAAIEHQLCLKDKTDIRLLEQIIVNCFGSDEFFINKAIGWALRDYSKTNPEWVKDFVNKYNDKMDSLSVKEASKYI